MLTRKHLLTTTLVLVTLVAPSLFADDRLFETKHGWYHSRTISTEGRIVELARSGQEYVLRLDNGTRVIVPGATDVRLRFDSRSTRRADERRTGPESLQTGDVVRVIGRPGANGTMFGRRIDVYNAADRTRTRRR